MGGASTAQTTLNLTNLAAGTYRVLVVPPDASTGSAELTLANGLTGSLPSDGSSQSFSSTVPRQNGYFTFSATAGDDLALAVTGLALSPSSPNYVRVWVNRPDGYSVTSFYCYTTTTPGCSTALMDLPLTGTYTVLVEPQGPSTMSFSIALSTDITGTLTAGTPMSLTFAAPGQNALPSFTATAGQTVALQLGSVSTTPSGKTLALTVYNASGAGIASGSTASQTTLNLTNLAAGTYRVLVVPPDASTGSAQLTLATGLIGSLPSNGSSQSFSTTVASQNGYFTFSATAGNDFGLALTGLSLSPSTPNYVRVYVDQPNGTNVANFYCYLTSSPGCTSNLLNLLETGTYAVRVLAQGAYTMSFTLTLSQDSTGTLTAGTPLSVNLSVPGALALPTFTATQGQSKSVTLSSISTTPSGKSVTLSAFNPSGGQIASTSNATQATLNLSNLAAGTYSVLVMPADAATATGQLQIQ
jgi:hypothetical protein